MRDTSGIVTVLLVGAIAAAAATLVSMSWEFGRDRIEANERARLLASLDSVLDDRHLGADVNPVLVTVTGEPLLGTAGPVDAFVPMRGREALAVVFATVAPAGYNAPISLLVGIDIETAAITGVRAVSHRETPGLGDRIELGKSSWIRQFDGRSLDDPAPAGWNVTQDGGVFDAITGATVTPRAVIEAVHNTLLYFEANRTMLIERARDALDTPSESGP